MMILVGAIERNVRLIRMFVINQIIDRVMALTRVMIDTVDMQSHALSGQY